MTQHFTSFACWLNTGTNHLRFAGWTTLATLALALALTNNQVLP